MTATAALGIALVAARYAKVDVLVHDANEKALNKSLGFLGRSKHSQHDRPLILIFYRYAISKGCQEGKTIQ